MSDFSYRFFDEGSEILLAICDSSLMGKAIKDKKRGLEIYVSDFYKGHSCRKKELAGLIKKATIINALGENIIKELANEKVVESGNIISIGGIPHAQIIIFREA